MWYTLKSDHYLITEKAELPPPSSSNALLPLSIGNLSLKGCSRYSEALQVHVAASAAARKGKYLTSYKKQMDRILLNLAQCMFSFKWMALPGGKVFYTPSHYLHDSCSLSYRSVSNCMDYLKAEDLVFVVQGYKDLKLGGGYTNKYFPTPKLQHQIWEAYLASEQSIEPPYVVFNGFDGPMVASDYDLDRMTKINEFMKDHVWACKGPFKLIYAGSIVRGGRIDNRFANIPMKKAPVRINTLIDGETVVEVDYKANHLRMALYLAGHDAPEDPYSVIDALLVDKIGRDKVKEFITNSLGAASEDQAFNALKSKRFTRALFNAVKSATQSVYPKLDLFNDLGAHLQSLEGQIAIDIMLAGVDAGIVVLPVHDSFVVQQRHEAWLTQVMLEVWPRHMSHDLPGPVAYFSVKRSVT